VASAVEDDQDAGGHDGHSHEDDQAAANELCHENSPPGFDTGSLVASH
jgi:hypothetical protein